MSELDFRQVFERATGLPSPYTYQCRLACGKDADPGAPTSLRSGSECESKLINIPTGLGKTAAVVLAWLWNRVFLREETWPRRFVYCLPMRTLVEQTKDNVSLWLERLRNGYAKANGQESDLAWLAARSPIILMGGEDATDWDLYPERPAILIGTQDMLLSRALNRGYGMTRYRWPIHFGLLNNDCLWVMDETQLMGPGLATACQLEALRHGTSESGLPKGLGSFPNGRSVTWYASATSNEEHLKTRDWRGVTRPEGFVFGLSTVERSTTSGPLSQRRLAKKVLELQRDWNFGDKQPSSDRIADILKRHHTMIAALGGNSATAGVPCRTLVICNTVDRAIAVHTAIASGLGADTDLVLMHSRFRPPERKDQIARLGVPDLAQFPGGQIIVATQVIEAGVDLSSAILWSEIAPLASLVQRLGRLNRAGEFTADIGWHPIAIVVGVWTKPAPPGEKKEGKEKRQAENSKRFLPYEREVSEEAWPILETLRGDAAPAALDAVADDVAASIGRCPYALQRHELLDFFDTDSNLSLGFTDVSPFVRGLDPETDLYVLWREDWQDCEKGGQPDFFPDFQRAETCPVPISKALAARAVLDKGWLWRGNARDARKAWISVRSSGLAPGMTIVLPLSAGGYDNATGWTGSAENNAHTSHYKPTERATDEDLLSCLANGWRTIAQHTVEVSSELDSILSATLSKSPNDNERAAFDAAALWHDVGKNYIGWQNAAKAAIEGAQIAANEGQFPIAKFSLSESPRLKNEDGQLLFAGTDLKREVTKLRRSFRPGMAHEVASALAFRQAEQSSHGVERTLASLLAEYLIMSHHGHVRKVLRDELPRFPEGSKDTETVRGIRHGEPLPTITINGHNLGCTALSTDCRRMGRDADGHEGYTRGVLRLLEEYGPFGLALFEALFRAADVRASILAQNSTPNS